MDRQQGACIWIATDRRKLKRQSLLPKAPILAVETVMIDHLAETGVIEANATGLLWMDAEAHEGEILEGASSLLARGTPLVLEWNPALFDRVGDRGKLERAVAESYTHFGDMHRRSDPKSGFPLHKVERLPAHAERFLDPEDPAIKTGILVIRLKRKQAATIRSLDAILRQSPASQARRDPAPKG